MFTIDNTGPTALLIYPFNRRIETTIIQNLFQYMKYFMFYVLHKYDELTHSNTETLASVHLRQLLLLHHLFETYCYFWGLVPEL